MFGRKRGAKGSMGSKGAKSQKAKKNTKAKKAVKRLLEKPGPDRMANIADMAAMENLQPFGVSLVVLFFVVYCSNLHGASWFLGGHDLRGGLEEKRCMLSPASGPVALQFEYCLGLVSLIEATS